MPINRTGLPRLAPQCGGGPPTTSQMSATSSQHSSLQSLVSLSRGTVCPTSNQLNKPSPRSLQVSPALAQRSLYAQHIMSSPEIIGVNTTDNRHHQNAKSALKTATSEFSFIRPDSPLTLPHNRPSNVEYQKRPVYQRSQSCLESQQQKLKQQNNGNNYGNNLPNGVNRSQSATSKQTMERIIHQSTRPSSIYGQPSYSDKVYTNRVNQRIPEHDNCADTDVRQTGSAQNRHSNAMMARMAMAVGVRDTKSMPKRQMRNYKPSKSDTIFATTNRLHTINSPNGDTGLVANKESDSGPKLPNRNRIALQSNEMFAVR